MKKYVICMTLTALIANIINNHLHTYKYKQRHKHLTANKLTQK